MKPGNGPGINLSSFTIIILTLVLGAALTFTSETFLSVNNIVSILYGVSINFWGTIGFVYLMIMGELDLSVGSVYAMSGMMVGLLMKNHWPLLPALVLALGLSAAVGFVNGFLVVRFKVPSMMITLGTMASVRGLANLLCTWLYGYPYPPSYEALARQRIGGIHLTTLVMIAAVIILEILLKRAAVFRQMYYVGENLETARIYGIKAGRQKIVIFTVMSLLAGVGGILVGSRLRFADSTIGNGLEFTILTAVVLGGASLSGGKGSILRAVVGLIFLATITTGMIVHNIEPLIQQLIVGIILIITVFIDTRMGRMGAGFGRSPAVRADPKLGAEAWHPE
ncbi:MAG: ABC transporter permease [Treponema sp.]|jgi:ribose transport system permease protein|nr:ABC transporter permease [Treponema sp.]